MGTTGTNAGILSLPTPIAGVAPRGFPLSKYPQLESHYTHNADIALFFVQTSGGDW